MLGRSWSLAQTHSWAPELHLGDSDYPLSLFSIKTEVVQTRNLLLLCIASIHISIDLVFFLTLMVLQLTKACLVEL